MGKHSRIYHPQDILDFGKHNGEKLKDVFKFQPSYIEWAIMQIPEFKIDIERFEELPNPTPFKYDANRYNPENIKKSKEARENGDMKSLFSYGYFANENDYPISLSEIKEMILDKPDEVVTIDYSFPKWIVKKNNSK